MTKRFLVQSPKLDEKTFEISVTCIDTLLGTSVTCKGERAKEEAASHCVERAIVLVTKATVPKAPFMGDEELYQMRMKLLQNIEVEK